VEPAAGTEANSGPPRAGFALLWDIFIKPGRAYATILATREWTLGLFAVVAATFGAAALNGPALAHAALVAAKRGPAGAPASGLLGQNPMALGLVASWYTIASLLVTAIVLQIAAMFRGQRRPFTLFLSLAVNCALPIYAGNLIGGLAVRLRDPASFSNLAQVARAFPESLAVFAPKAGDAEAIFLANFDLFALWSLLLLAFGFVRITGISLVAALVLCFGIAFGLTLLGSWGSG
jgi:hypothetical protein